MSVAAPTPQRPRERIKGDALALEAYSDRLGRARARLEAEMRAALGRLARARHEREALHALAPAHRRALADAGLLAIDADAAADSRLIDSHREQLRAIDELDRLTGEAIDRLDHPEPAPIAALNYGA